MNNKLLQYFLKSGISCCISYWRHFKRNPKYISDDMVRFHYRLLVDVVLRDQGWGALNNIHPFNILSSFQNCEKMINATFDTCQIWKWLWEDLNRNLENNKLFRNLKNGAEVTPTRGKQQRFLHDAGSRMSHWSEWADDRHRQITMAFFFFSFFVSHHPNRLQLRVFTLGIAAVMFPPVIHNTHAERKPNSIVKYGYWDHWGSVSQRVIRCRTFIFTKRNFLYLTFFDWHKDQGRI